MPEVFLLNSRSAMICFFGLWAMLHAAQLGAPQLALLVHRHVTFGLDDFVSGIADAIILLLLITQIA